MALNPNPMEEDRNAIVHRDIKRKAFRDLMPEGKEVIPEGGNYDQPAPVAEVIDEVGEIVSGVGSLADLKVSLPDEDEPIPYQLESRLLGHTVHEAMHFPEQNFGYGVQKRGRRLVTERRSGYEVRVDAHPEKLIKGVLTHELRGVKRFHYQAELDVNAGAPRAEYRARLKWAGRKILRSESDVKSLFVAANTIHVTKAGADKATWTRQGNDVIDLKNAPHMSGVISGDHLKKSNYQAEFEFTPTYTTQKGTNNAFVNVRRVSSTFRTYKGSGWGEGKYWDDDLVGLIFKAQSKRDFYMLLWEGDERLAGSSRINNLDKYKIDHPTLFVHGNNTTVSGIAGAANDGRGAIDKKKWIDYRDNKGWGKRHARVYRVKDGVINEVKIEDNRKTKRGWNLGKKQGMRVVSNGKSVKLFLKNGASWELAFEFQTAYESGSFGMCNISQAVKFHKISYQEHGSIRGYLPEEGWFRTRKQNHVIASNIGKYVTDKARAKHKKDFYDVTHVSLLEDPKTAILGSITGKWPDGALTLKTKNPAPDAVLTTTIKKSGYLDIDPNINSPWNHMVVFDGAMELFKDEVAAWLKRTGAAKVTDYSLDIIRPTNEDDDDWDLIGDANEKLIAWNASVKQETEEVELPIYAYEGEKKISLSEWFGLNEYSTASFEVDEDVFDKFFDSYRVEGTGESLAIILKTNEWYKGGKVSHLRLNGQVSSLAPITLELPSAPEHYEDVLSGAPMYHGHERIRFTLMQVAPLDQTVSSTFGKAGDATTTYSSEKNQVTGQPLVMTKDENDIIIVSALPDPREVAWTSSKKEGKASVNGVRPFLSAGRGKQDTKIDISDLAEPDDLIAVDGIDVDVDNRNVQYVADNEQVTFYSTRETAYIFHRPWAGDWVQDLTNRFAVRTPKRLTDVKEPSRDNIASNVVISGLEAVASDPFVVLKAIALNGGETGLIGKYYQREHSLRVVTETLEVSGASEYYQQEQEMETWRDSLVFRLYPGATDIVATIEGAPANYTRLGDNLIFERAVTGPGRILVKHRVGKLGTDYLLKKVHGVQAEVYLDSEKLTSGYVVGQGTLTLSEEPVGYSTITVRSLRLELPYGPGREDMGRYHGSRIDREIWFNWGDDGPFPLVDHVAAQAEQHIADVELTLTVEQRQAHDLIQVEAWAEYNGARATDASNTGEWKGPSSGFTYLVSTKNQGAITAKMDPVRGSHIGLSTNITIMPADDDAAGILFVDKERREHIVIGWDSGGVGFDGLSVERWTCQNPQEYGAQNLIFTKVRKYNAPEMIGEKDPNRPGNILARSDRSLEAIYNSVEKTLTFRMDKGESVKVDVGVSLGECEVGVFTLSQADTRFSEMERIFATQMSPETDVRLLQTIMRSFETPQSTSTQRDFTFEMAKPIGAVFNESDITSGEKIVSRSYRITNTVSTGAIFFNETTTQETINPGHTLSVIVRGLDKEPGLPEWIEGDLAQPPNLPDIELPPVSSSDAFAVEWTGKMSVEVSGRHEFEITANEGIILEIDGKEVFRGFGLKDGIPRVAGIELKAGNPVDFRLRYYENSGVAYIRIRMKEPGGEMRRIPEERFRTGATYAIEAKKMERYPEDWRLAIDSGDFFIGKQEHHLYAEKVVETHSPSTSKQVVLNGTNKQGAPIQIRRGDETFKEVFAIDEYGARTHELFESFADTGSRKFLLGVEKIEKDHVKVWRNGVLESFIVEGRHVVVSAPLAEGEELVVRHSDPVTYFTEWEDGKTVVTFHPGFNSSLGPVTVSYESTERKYSWTERSLQPLRTDDEGMVWLQEESTPVLARLHVTLSRQESNATEKVTLYVKATDSLGNPVEGENISIQHPNGSLVVKTNGDGLATTRVLSLPGVYLARAKGAVALGTLSVPSTDVILTRVVDGRARAEVRDEQGRFIKEISEAIVYNGVEGVSMQIPKEGLKLPNRSVMVVKDQERYASCMTNN